jgi:hypothetical protein
MDNRKIYRLLTLSCMFFVIIIVIYLLSFKDYYWEKSYLDEKYKGKVLEKYIDESNHSYRVVILDSKEKVSLPSTAYDLFDLINIGDSLVKESSTLVGYIKKGDEVLIIDYKAALPD